MALDLSALTPYTDEISSGLAKQIVLAANTINGDLVTVKYGVLGDTYKLNFVKSSMIGTNALCNNTDAGSTTLAQGSITMSPVTFAQSICLEDLRQYWYDYEMQRQYDTEDLGSEKDVITANKMESIALELDKMIWQGSVSAGSGNLALMDGFVTAAVALTGEITVTLVNISTATLANVIVYMDAIVAALPASILLSAELYLSPADFQKVLLALRSINLFNYDTQSTQVTSIHYPGSIGLTIHSTSGLVGAPSGTFIATAKENIVLAFGGNNDLSYNAWYSMDLQSYKINSKTKLGVGYYFPELVVRSN